MFSYCHDTIVYFHFFLSIDIQLNTVTLDIFSLVGLSDMRIFFLFVAEIIVARESVQNHCLPLDKCFFDGHEIQCYIENYMQ